MEVRVGFEAYSLNYHYFFYCFDLLLRVYSKKEVTR